MSTGEPMRLRSVTSWWKALRSDLKLTEEHVGDCEVYFSSIFFSEMKIGAVAERKLRFFESPEELTHLGLALADWQAMKRFLEMSLAWVLGSWQLEELQGPRPVEAPMGYGLL